jgi:hypothetical protein
VRRDLRPPASAKKKYIDAASPPMSRVSPK